MLLCIEIQENYYLSILNHYENIKKFKHDIKAHLLTMQYLLNEENYEDRGYDVRTLHRKSGKSAERARGRTGGSESGRQGGLSDHRRGRERRCSEKSSGRRRLSGRGHRVRRRACRQTEKRLNVS